MRISANQALQRGAFSLVEICLALSIFAFSLVTIMALFPLAIKSSDESLTTGRITEIGNSFLAELRSVPFVNASLATEAGPCHLDLSLESEAFILLDSEGMRLRPGTTADYFSGSKSQAAYIARLRTLPVSASGSRSATLTLDIESPANAPSSSRTRETFVTIVREQQ